ncbi:MAG: ATP-grasp domain-containing protein [Bacteroidales bacterium]|nr:ATP-grasp domain-containing protein [Bacteroidales bacterium]
MENTFKNKRVFISGGNGVIGNELVKILHGQDAIIFVGDLKPRPIEWPQNIIYRQGDLNYITKEELEDFKPEIFFHLAATFERSTETYNFWDENFQHNINLSHHLMTLLKPLESLKRVVFASSYLIYEPSLYQFREPQQTPFELSEQHPINPRNLTGMAKLAHEIELNFLSQFQETKFSTVSVRIFRGYGRNSRDVISRWIRSLINKETIYLYKKEGIFDYIYAKDTAEGLARLALSDYNGIVNLGTGKSRKVEDIISILKNYFPDAQIIEKNENIPFEASQANISKLVKITNWKPKYTLEKSIPEIIEFEKQRNGIYDESKTPVCNVLITSISKKVPLVQSVKDATQKINKLIKVFGGDVDKNCIAKYFVDDFWEMPKIDTLGIEEVINYCKQNNITAIIPTRDGELAYWSKNKNILKNNGINVMVSDFETVNICIDKLMFYNILSNKYPIIFTTDNINNLKNHKIVVKERYGAGSQNIAINVSFEDALNHSKKLINPIFQPYIEGEEFSVDVYISNKNICKGVVLRKRDLIVNGESQITTTFKNEEIETLFKKLSYDLNLFGHAVYQAIIDKNKNIHIIECNCRFGGASTLSLAVGIDTFYWFLLESNGVDITEYYSKISNAKATQIRYNKDYIFFMK